MGDLTKADLVWNRATTSSQSHWKRGDRALHDLLFAHGLIMNGGVLHAVEILEQSGTLEASEEGYQYFSLEDVVVLLEKARKIPSVDAAKVESLLDQDYVRIVPSDSALIGSFEAHFHLHPEAYAPLDSP